MEKNTKAGQGKIHLLLCYLFGFFSIYLPIFFQLIS